MTADVDRILCEYRQHLDRISIPSSRIRFYAPSSATACTVLEQHSTRFHRDSVGAIIVLDEVEIED